MTENLNFLPNNLLDALNKLRSEGLYEIRVRADKQVSVCYGGKYYPLNKLSGCGDLIFTPQQLASIVVKAAEYSVYAINNQISAGFLSIRGGIRMGIAGEAVYESGKVKTQRNFHSLVIRIPHEVIGCAAKAYEIFFGRGADKSAGGNLLIISPPGGGKTTLLRDLCRLISGSGRNVLLVDERSELAACSGGRAGFDVGANTDIISGALKEYAFGCGIRSMRPDYIITDELAAGDLAAVEAGINSGVYTVASVHARGVEELKKREEFFKAMDRRLFDGYVVLSAENPGKYEGVFDESFKRLL